MKKILIFLVIIITSYFVWTNSNAVSIGENEFSNNDIDNLFSIEQDLAKIIGSNAIKNKEDVLYNLVMVSLQKNILLENKVDLNIKDNTKVIENSSIFKKIYKKSKKLMGDSYYKLMIEPIIVTKLFYQFYQKVEPSRQNANKVLELLRKYKFKSVVNSLDVKPIMVDIPKTNSILLKELNNKTGIYSKIISLGDKFIVANIIGYDNKFIKTQSFVFTKMLYADFLKKVLTLNSVKFPVYSIYNLNDIVTKKGSILK